MKHILLFSCIWSLNCYVHAQLIGQFERILIGNSVSSIDVSQPEHNALSILSDTSGNTSILFMFPHNIYYCGGLLYDRNRIRYSLSIDGGQSWDVGAGVSTSFNYPPPAAHCMGIGEVNPTYQYPGPFPMGHLFYWGDSTLDEDLRLAAVASARDTNGQFFGNVQMEGSELANTFVNIYDYYRNPEPTQLESSGFVKRTEREFWYAAHTQVGGTGIANILLFKSVFDTLNEKMNWSIAARIPVEHVLTNGGEAQQNRLNLAFSPDGSKGYVSWLGDIVGKSDSVLSPILIESIDGGATWGEAIEMDINSFPELRDSVKIAMVFDSLSGSFSPIASGRLTTAYQHDLIVDEAGNPHLFTTIGAAGLRSETFIPYQFYAEAPMQNLSFTRDSFGDWGAIYVSPQRTFDYEVLQPVTNDAPIYQAVQPQVSRSQDGKYLFYLWMDTDSSLNNWQPEPKPLSPGLMTNTRPDVQLRVLNASTQEWSPIYNLSQSDSTFAGRAFYPQISTELIKEDNQTYRLPLVLSALGPSLNFFDQNANFYFYLDKIKFNVSAIQTPATFLYNCKANPISIQTQATQPNCGQNDGMLQAVISGGVTPFELDWNTGDSSSLITDLVAGFYSLQIKDDLGCPDSFNITLNNIGSPGIVIDSASVSDISCYGANDGMASVSLVGVTGFETYSWSNGEIMANASALLPGLNTLMVVDTNACEAYEYVMINEPDSIKILAIEALDLKCAGDSNGVVSVLARGGTGSLHYDWGLYGVGNMISGLSGGLYDLLVTDENSCEAIRSIEVSSPPALTITLDAIFAAADGSGTAQSKALGGTPPYDYKWRNIEDWCPYSISGSLITGICNSMRYEYSVTDANQCMVADTILFTEFGCWSDNIDAELVAGITYLQLFPNPAKELVQLQIEFEQPEKIKLSLFNTYGQQIKQVSLSAINSALIHTIDVSTLSRGVYFVEIETSRGQVSKRFIIQ